MSSSLCVQTSVGDVGRKAVSLHGYNFASLVNSGKFQYGCNNDGIFLLNTGEQDNGVDYTRTVTFASTDFGISSLKRIRFLYFGIDTNEEFTVSVMGDNKVWRDYTVVLSKQGLQEVRRSIGRDGFGRYWKIKISSSNRFRLDSLHGLLIVRQLGLKG